MNQGNDAIQRQKRKDELSDEEIIELYWTRNEKAIEWTDRKYGRFLFGIAYNIVHNRMDCEECLNDTYLGTWNRIPPTRPSIFHVFLSRITRNIAVNRYKKNEMTQKRIPSELMVSMEELGESIPDGALSPEEALAATELSRVMRAYLDTLEERSCFMFVCRYYYGDRVSTIARMLQISEKTVARTLTKIKEGLREALEKEGMSV